MMLKADLPGVVSMGEGAELNGPTNDVVLKPRALAERYAEGKGVCDATTKNSSLIVGECPDDGIGWLRSGVTCVSGQCRRRHQSGGISGNGPQTRR